MVLAEAASVVATLKNASDLASKLIASNKADAQALLEVLVSARLQALDLIEQNALLMDERAALNERVKVLESENRHLVDFGDQSEKYERIQTQSQKFVYREKNPPGGNAGAPFFCPKCFLEKKASILQGRMEDTFHICPTCRWCDHF